MRNELAELLFLDELRSVKEYGQDAVKATQTINQWSLGAMSAIAAGYVVYLGGRFGKASGGVSICVLALLLPAISWLSCLAWWGEVHKVARMSVYVHERERQVSAKTSKLPHWTEAPLYWETWQSIQPSRLPQVGYVAALGIYGLFMVGPLVCLTAITKNFWWIIGVAFALTLFLLTAALGGIRFFESEGVLLERSANEGGSSVVVRLAKLISEPSVRILKYGMRVMTSKEPSKATENENSANSTGSGI